MYDPSFGLVIGGWDGNNWVSDKAWHGRIRGSERYRFYGANGTAGEASGGKALVSEASGAAWNVKLQHAPAADGDCMGLTGAWNAMPRKSRDLNPDSAVFRAAVAEVLRAHGLTGVPVKVTRAIQVDLDGDGTDEAIICANHPRLMDARGGPAVEGTNGHEPLTQGRKADYSFVMLRHQRGGRYVSEVLSGQFSPGRNDTPTISEIGTPLDLNGDGRMEIVIRWRYYEGGGVHVFEMKNGRARPVLEASDGA